VKRIGFRVVRIFLVAVLAFGAYSYLAARGVGWLLLPIALAITLLLVVTEVLRLRARRKRAGLRDTQWEDALLDAEKRPAAIASLRVRLIKAGDNTDRARLRVALAELLDADGKSAEAGEVLADIDEGALPPVDGAVVRHARAEIALRRGDLEVAHAALEGRSVTCGDAELDVRLDLLSAQVEIERGGAEGALKVARRVGASAGKDADLARDAAIVEACALDGLERRAEALALLRPIDAELRPVIAALGSPRVRALLAALDAP
jgi:hypothetical protein